MGLPISSLVKGTYYKGVDGNSNKIFLFVENAIPCAPSGIEVVAWKIRRGTPQKPWKKLANATVPGTSDSLMVSTVTSSYVVNDVGSLCPGDIIIAKPAPIVAAPTPYTMPPKAVPTPYVPPKTVVSEAEKAKIERNKGKETIPANAHSKTCVKCGGTNKEAVLSLFSVYWCPKCEPE